MELWWPFTCQVNGIETLTTYDPKIEEFVINIPCESTHKHLSMTNKCKGSPIKCMDLLDIVKHKKEEVNCFWSFYKMWPTLLSFLNCQ
jgi:hypothetical protein